MSENLPGQTALMRRLKALTAHRLCHQQRKRIMRRVIRQARDLLYSPAITSPAAGTGLQGFMFPPSIRHLPDGEREDALAIIMAKLTVEPRPQAASTTLGWVYPHAVERLFMRLDTASLETVASELGSALPCLARLSTAVRGCGRKVLQLPVPTSQGFFLARATGTAGAFALHTWLPLHCNPRIDYTLAAIKAWFHTPAADACATLRCLLADSRNRWIQQPYPFPGH